MAVTELRIERAGLVPYELAWERQRELHAARVAGEGPDTMLLLEHPSVYTAGKRTLPHERPFDGTPVIDVDRGGKITWHGPGQIVGYPITRLRAIAGDAPTYVWRLEETIARALAELGIAIHRDPANRGVFAEAGKIAAIGVAVTHGVTMHGFALNACPDLDNFRLIDPCGIGDLGVTSIERILGTAPDLPTLRASLAEHFGAVFERRVRPAPPEFWALLARWGVPTSSVAPKIRLTCS
jgi:lipoyl(octanoyl) transferase